MGGNLLDTLQGGTFTGLARMEKLFLLSNNLREIHPDGFAGLSNLLWLALNNNLLTTLPADLFTRIPKLHRL